MGKYLSQAKAIREAMDKAGTALTDMQALDSTNLFRPWNSGELVVANDIRRYAGLLYRCIQGHTTQANWTPADTPALWTRISVEDWPEWKQPLSTEAYALGAKVSHAGFHWSSGIANNVWEPGVYGWNKVE